MKYSLIILLTLITSLSFSQKREKKSFYFNNTEIEYLRVDYSKHGIAHFFVTMYNETLENKILELKATSCLSGIKNLYHTLYFFLEIPKEFINEEKKTKIFSAFMIHLKEVEPTKTYNLYLNFDVNYSIPFQLDGNKVERIITDINSKNICRKLTIR